MALTSRLTPAGDPAQNPEDFFEDSLGVVFEDDAKTLRRYHCLHQVLKSGGLWLDLDCEAKIRALLAVARSCFFSLFFFPS